MCVCKDREKGKGGGEKELVVHKALSHRLSKFILWNNR